MMAASRTSSNRLVLFVAVFLCCVSSVAQAACTDSGDPWQGACAQHPSSSRKLHLPTATPLMRASPSSLPSPRVQFSWLPPCGSKMPRSTAHPPFPFPFCFFPFSFPLPTPLPLLYSCKLPSFGMIKNPHLSRYVFRRHLSGHQAEDHRRGRSLRRIDLRALCRRRRSPHLRR